VFLSVDELQKLLKLYDNRLLAENLHNSLIVFIVQAFTSLRISDAKLLNENWLNGNELQFMPYKTRRYQKTVSFGLSKVAKRLVDDFIQHKREVKIKAEPKINLDLKLIAAMAGINKRITTHTARHTFATVFLRLGGTVETLREIMGHTNIMTTMQYVHLIDHQKTEQMGNFDNQFQ
jgi:integrase